MKRVILLEFTAHHIQPSGYVMGCGE